MLLIALVQQEQKKDEAHIFIYNILITSTLKTEVKR